ncbi:hypothetical protein RHMOL_Rhmol08G0097900 [Rhododendron molle]|uniref:Uncharacterized protein n=1 Tax=Rhododendron molle TaxID=49168 RepID=A0ACC0MM07_RHOML|nr:hypothetical protein RHMOL_Rhmol08G0097900 [Rhododendron molle]
MWTTIQVAWLALYVYVPSDEDSVAEKRKGDELVVPEWNKKKKKQVSTPRPACSWVHFSREFIKEYSASHPESSGLKAATKAASDAWKSMSVEEKAKYSRRAREVWDNYLSTAPARVPKPRRQAKLITRCSPGRLLNVLQRLTPDQKVSVRSMGFGGLLGLRCRTLRRSLCLWLLERFNTARSSMNICGVRIPLSPQDVELVLGLAADGKDVVNSGPDDLIAELRQSYNATNHGISLRLLEDRLSAPEAGDDFKRSFVLYALGTLLCPTARLDVSPSFLHFLTNMDVIHQYNWGKFLLDRLVRELLYYERISVGGPRELVPTVVPCLSSWGEEEISEREKREKELGGYGRGEVIYKERSQSMELVVEDGAQQDGTPVGEVGTIVEHGLDFADDDVTANEDKETREITTEKENIQVLLEKGNVICADMGVVVEPVRGPCCNTEYGCPEESVTHTGKNDHEETCIYAPCSCPLQNCAFIGSSEQLSGHFSSKHWDSGRHFQYNCPLPVSLHKDERFLVLQAEEDGLLFLLNKGVETIGHTLMVNHIGPSSSKVGFFYDLVSEKGTSSLRLKSCVQSFPGLIEGLPPVDFLLIPFGYASSSGQLSLEVCIWNSTELGAD